MESARASRFLRTAAVLGPPLLVLLFAAALLAALHDATRRRDEVERTHRVGERLQTLLVRLVDAETAQRGFLLSGDTVHLAPLRGVRGDVERATEDLRGWLKDERQRARLDSLVPVLEGRLAAVDTNVARRRAGLEPVSSFGGRSGREWMDDARRRVAAIQAAQRRSLAAREARERRATRMLFGVLLGGAAVSTGLALLINARFARHAAAIGRANEALEAQARELEEKNLLLQDQAVELETQAAELTDTNHLLQEQAVELEAQAAELEESSRAVRASEERFRSLIENSAEAIAVIGADGVVRYESPGVARMLGHPPQSLLGTPAADLVHPDDLPGLQRAALALLRGPGADAEAEFRARHADGSWHRLEAVASNLLAEHAVEGIVLNARDVTVRRETEEALRHTEEQLLQASKMEAVGRLAGGIAHDFNNLLTVITGNASLLSAEMGQEGRRPAELDQISRAADRAAQLTRQLLTFSRRHVVQPRIVSLNDVVRGIEKMLRRVISEQIEIRTSLEAGTRPVRADPVQLEQVLMNLAVNASDAMPDGGRLLFETRNVDVDASLLYPGTAHEGLRPAALLAVSDTGVGMDAATQQRVFEPFFTTKEPGKGTGLGLSTVYGIVNQAGGRIWMYSEPGHGTTFKIYFPPAAGTAPPEGAPPRPHAPRTGTETILLVEDEPAVRVLVQNALEQAGYAVLAAEGPDGAAALAEAHDGPIHLLLTDVVMPGRSGRALADELGRRRPGFATLFMSGYTDDAILGQGILGQDVAFLEKPFTPVQLLQKVRQALEGVTEPR